jgi:hypothetical protein
MITPERFFRLSTDTLGLSGLSYEEAPPDYEEAIKRLYPLPQTADEELAADIKAKKAGLAAAPTKKEKESVS